MTSNLSYTVCTTLVGGFWICHSQCYNLSSVAYDATRWHHGQTLLIYINRISFQHFILPIAAISSWSHGSLFSCLWSDKLNTITSIKELHSSVKASRKLISFIGQTVNFRIIQRLNPATMRVGRITLPSSRGRKHVSRDKLRVEDLIMYAKM